MRKRTKMTIQGLAVILLGLVAIVLIGGGVLKSGRFATFDFLLAHRWWLLGGFAIFVMIVHRLTEWRIACPVCGTRPFPRVYTGGGGDNSWMRFVVRHCRSCGLRQVECDRGVRRLPETNWERAAKRYALPARERWSLRRRRAKKRLCRQCGYDLRATAEERGPLLNRCPECGRMA